MLFSYYFKGNFNSIIRDDNIYSNVLFNNAYFIYRGGNLTILALILF